jgi:hypothetical protein
MSPQAPGQERIAFQTARGSIDGHMKYRMMSIYRIIRISGEIGYKVHVTNASRGLRVIGIFLSEAAASDWINTDRAAHAPHRDHLVDAMLDRG